MKHKDFSVVLALLFSVSVHAQNFAGTWSGKISFSGNSLHIVFNISENAEGGTVCKMDSPDQGVKGIPASIELVSSDSISIRVSNLGIEYNGKLTDGVIHGTFSQAGLQLGLDLKNERLVYHRPQNPEAPYPYMTEEIEFVNEDVNAILSGTLTYPLTFCSWFLICRQRY